MAAGCLQRLRGSELEFGGDPGRVSGLSAGESLRQRIVPGSSRHLGPPWHIGCGKKNAHGGPLSGSPPRKAEHHLRGTGLWLGACYQIMC